MAKIIHLKGRATPGLAHAELIVPPNDQVVRVILAASGVHESGAANNSYDVVIDEEVPTDIATPLTVLYNPRVARRLLLAPGERFSTFGAENGGAVVAAAQDTIGFFPGDARRAFILPGEGLWHVYPLLAGAENFAFKYTIAEFPKDMLEELLKS